MSARRRRRRIGFAVGVLAAIAAAVACKEPTQVTVKITTAEPCAKLVDVDIVVASDPTETQSRFENGFSTAVTTTCDANGTIGTLVLTPAGGSGSILVAAAVRLGDGSPPPASARCSDPEIAKRCIIARRTVTFVENKPLVLPIELDPLCIGVSCDPASTCYRGSCVDATAVCNDSDCTLPAEGDGGGVGEGGANEASSSDGSYDAEPDGFVADADAGTDVDLADVMPDSDAAVDVADGAMTTYPPCSYSPPSYYCSTPGGLGTAGPCEVGPATPYCCRCTCVANAAVSMCGLSMASGACSNLMPTCP